MLILTGLELYTPQQVIPEAALVIEADKIVFTGPAAGLPLPTDAQVLRLPGRRAFPGFIDLHTHGLLGKDAFGSQLADVIRLLPRYGVTAFLATTVTLPLDKVHARLRQMAEVLRHPPEGAHCLGIHLEGNFLSPRRTGMANPDWTQPLTKEIFTSLQKAAGGFIKLVTFAPEEGASMQLIPWLIEQDVVPSIGHSDASYEQVAEAVGLGLRHASHTFNAMTPLHHRAPGVVGAVLAFPEVTAQLIADGHHVHPGVMRLLLNAKGVNGVCLVSDSAPFAGLPDGTYPWEGYTLIVKDGTCRLPDGTLAGAHALLDSGFRNLINLVGLPPSEAAVCITEVPARVLASSPLPSPPSGVLRSTSRGEGSGERTGQGSRATTGKGRLQPGCDADAVVMKEEYEVEMSIIGGKIVYP